MAITPGRILGISVVTLSVLVVGSVLLVTQLHPRTDDATVRANFIEVAPEVEGRIVQLPVHDNAFVHKGDLLFEIDPRSYQYALDAALSDQAALDQQIIDQKRHIAAETSAADAANAQVQHSDATVKTASTTVAVSTANIGRAEASVQAAKAHLEFTKNDLARIEPLLARQYVTVQQVDVANTAVRVAQGDYDEAVAALKQATEQQRESQSRQVEAGASYIEAQAKLRQSFHDIDTIDTLESERAGRAARVERASVDLERTRVLAPFDAYVTNMNISEGAYAKPGAPMFTLIDARNWYVIANYRESKLSRIHLGSRVDIFLLEHPEHRFEGVVDGIGHGVFPDDGGVDSGLPNVDKTLNWVHLSTRFPVRIRISNPDPNLVRIGATAVTIVR